VDEPLGSINSVYASRFEQAGWVFVFLFAFSDLFSISIAQISAAGMCFCWGGRWYVTKEPPDFSPAKWPILAFVASSLVAAMLSMDVTESLKDSKDLLHIFIFLAAYDLFRRYPARIETAFRVVSASGGLIAVVGLGQALMRGVRIDNRISGFNDIYMTYAGLLMLATIMGLAVALFSFRKWKDAWIPAALGLMIFAILLSLTRNSWVGLVAGGTVLVALRKPAALFAGPVLVMVVVGLAPANVQDRIYSVFDIQNVSNRERIYLWKAGSKIIADFPVFGVGQNAFPLVYPKYRDPGVKEPNISHLHNNFLELAVERGLIGLACWMSMWSVALWSVGMFWIRSGKPMDPPVRVALAACLGSVTAFLCAGVFEYNFGDSEIQMLFYFVMAAGMGAANPAVTGAGRGYK